ncbi:IS110 family transposase [Streptomyces sp. NPDC005728]|uniref:IS110 family transposase n=1 Tax=Streptomyces sp. NPDC005728 TaxID=3157054 RepID=UPI0033FABBE4
MADAAAEESEQGPELVERVAAIDIAKASGMVCTRVPHEDKPGRKVQRVWNVAATSGAILELADHLICQGITRVVMEATSTYWKPFFFLLEARGLECWLVNARDVKNVPGRPKTDKLDSVWLAKLAERGMLRPSFVPPKPVRELRDLTRSRAVLTHERTRHKQRAEKLLENAQIKLSTVISDIFGVSGRAMLEALIAGERSPRALAGLAHGTIKASPAALEEALAGGFEEHHAFMLRMLLDTVDYLTVQIDKLTARITTRLGDLSTTTGNTSDTDDDGPGQGMLMPLTDVERLDEIPGVGPATAQVILAEIGTDMSVFPTADKQDSDDSSQDPTEDMNLPPDGSFYLNAPDAPDSTPTKEPFDETDEQDSGEPAEAHQTGNNPPPDGINSLNGTDAPDGNPQ